MATNHTTNYGLNLWEPGDSFLREEFNENTEKIEEAIKAQEMVTGSYIQQPTADIGVELGFRPRLVIVVGTNRGNHAILLDGAGAEGGINVSDRPYVWASSLSITDTGFSVPKNYDVFNQTAGEVVYFMAFR